MVEIITKVKQAGRRRDLIGDKRYKLSKNKLTIEEIIKEIVETDVANYNEEKNLLKYLTKEEVDERASIGKIDFNERKNHNKQDLESAIKNAVLSFKDGIYLVFVNGEQKENIQELVEIENEDEILFVRLVMLAGRLW